MPRKRMIDPDIWNSRQFTSLSMMSRILFIGMFSLADDDGRARAYPGYWKKEIFGYDLEITPQQIAEYEIEIAKKELIRIYRNGHECYLTIPKFRIHQKINHPSESKLPKPPDNEANYINSTDQLTDDYSIPTVDLPKDSPQLIKLISISKLTKDGQGESSLSNNENKKTFNNFKILLKSSNNKIAVLVDAFKEWHSDAPNEDFEHNTTYGRLGKALSRVNQDYGYLLKILWDTVTASISGSHLSYIDAIIAKKVKQLKQDEVKNKMQGVKLDQYKSREEDEREKSGK